MQHYLLGTITPEGKKRLLQMLDDPRYSKWLDNLLRKNFNQMPTATEETPGTDAFVASVQAKMASAHDTEEDTSAASPWKWQTLAVAASIIVLLGIGVFRYTQKTEETTLVVKEQNLIAPASAGAILTLADGSQIVLDSVANGVLAEQNHTSVVKKEGTLVYAASQSTKAYRNNMRTPRGRQYQLVLSDGTKVWLNAASSISFPTAFVAKERRVTLSGEAYFEVAKDAKHPFIVTTKGMEVRVLGTHFNINSYAQGQGTQTTLIEGSVVVSQNHKKTQLSPGQQAELLQSGAFQVKKLENFDEVLAWKQGHFYFNNASLEKVMQELSRWYDVDVVFEKGVPQRNFDGEISRDLNLDQVLKVLETNNIRFKLEGKIVRVLP